VYKAFLFSLLVLAFHIVEEGSKQLLHGDGMATASHEIRLNQLLARTVVVFCTFLPLFAYRELRRVLSEDNFIRDSGMRSPKELYRPLDLLPWDVLTSVTTHPATNQRVGPLRRRGCFSEAA
jgi:hypothetical protein